MSRVNEFLLKYEDAPWVRGEHDCVLFIQKFTQEVYGKPYANPQDYPFHSFGTALRAFRSICKDHSVDTFNEVLDIHYCRVDLPVEGGLVAKPDGEGLTGYTYGISYDSNGYFVDGDGLVVLELNPMTDLYWSIE